MTPPTPLSTTSLWTKWGLSHVEAICAGVIAGAWVAGRFGLGTIAAVAGLVLVVSYGVRHIVKG